MKCGEATLVVVATATVFGALASAIALRFFYRSHSRNHPSNHSQNDIVSNNRSSRDPFDPSKRKGSVNVNHCLILVEFTIILKCLMNADTCPGMTISWQLHFCQLKDPKTLTGRSYFILLKCPCIVSQFT